MADLRRTILLARPGAARERLRDALAQAGVDVVLEADPLQTEMGALQAADARNLVIVVDAEVEDALDRFDALLADDRYQILFEEASVVSAREGWDAARWSRHLGAKLLRHGDVLPEGHESDDAPLDDGALLDASLDNVVSDAADESPDVMEVSVEAEVETSNTTLDISDAPETEQAISLEASTETTAWVVGEDGELLADADDLRTDEVAAELEVIASEEASQESALLEAALPEPSVDAAQDWMRFQDFEAVNDLPAANMPQTVETDFRAALAPLDDSHLPHDEAYQRLEEEMSQFDVQLPADRWQDFERPQAEVEAEPEVNVEMDAEVSEANDVAHASPTDASSWALSDEPLAVAPEAPASKDELAGFAKRIAGLSLVDDEAEAEAAELTQIQAETAAVTAVEGAILLVGGLGGPDPLRQILQQLDKSFGAPVLVQQWLDGGQYDRLVRQMDRASQMPVELAAANMPLQASHVYIIPTSITVKREADGVMRFIDASTRGFADVLSALPAASSGVVILSGASEDYVEQVNRFLQAGGRVFAQASEGCYDHAVPALIIQRGAEAQLPAVIASQLTARWQQQVSA